MSAKKKTPTAYYGKLSDFTPLPDNPNAGSERSQYMMETSFETAKAGRSGLAAANNTLLAGNHASQVAGQVIGDDVIVVETTGDQYVIVKRVDVADETTPEAKTLIISDNRASDVHSYDADIIQKYVDEDRALLDKYFRDDELAEILAGLETPVPVEDAEPQINRADELQKVWQTERGQVWEIPSKSVVGKSHRVMCGDSTSAEDVARLMGGEKAYALWTDPPYGVDYVGKTKDALTIANDSSLDLPELLSGAFRCADAVLLNGAPLYIAHPPGALSVVFANAYLATGWKFHETLAWIKDTMVLGHSDYHYQHEPIIYGWKGANRFWYGGRSQKSTLFVDRPQRSENHPTMKPPELVALCLKNSTKRDDNVLDPFLGSGTTMIAAEQTGRLCYGMEISPAYVAVILQRAADIGLTPRKVMNG